MGTLSNHHFTLSQIIGIGKKMCQRSADVKSWRIGRKADRELHTLAKELVAGRGYFWATDVEMTENYGIKHTPRDDRRHAWTVMAGIPDSSGRVRLSLVCLI